MNHPLRQNARLTSFLRKALKPCFAVCALAPVFWVRSASAQLIWEGNDNLGGSGNWNLTPGNTVWSNNGLPPGTTAWTNPNTATFSGPDAPATVTITGSSTVINATAITFTTSGYTITDDGSGAALQLDNGTAATSATITVNAGKTATITTALTSGFNADSLTINGGGTLTINGFNDATYFGATITIDGGTTVRAAVNVVQGTGNFAIPQASAIVIGDGTGTGELDLNGTSQSILSLAGGTNGTVINTNTGAYSNLTVGIAALVPSTTFAGQITDTATTVETTNHLTPNGGLGLTVAGPSNNSGYTLILSGTANTNTYHGMTVVGDGVVAATLEAGATDTFSQNSAVNVNAGATLDIHGFTQTIAALDGTGTGTVTNNGVALPATLTLNGDGLSDTLKSSANIVDGATSTIALTKNGNYTQVLAGNNTYSGATTVNTGTLANGSTTGFSPNSAYTMGAGAFLDLNGFNASFGSLLGSGTLTNGSGNVTGPVTGNATVSVGSLNTSQTTFIGNISDGTSGTLALTKVGTGTLLLGGNNTYSGATTVSNGTLAIGATTALDQSSAYTITTPGILDLNSFSGSIGSLAGSGTVINGGGNVAVPGIGAATLTAGNNTSTAYSGVLEDGTSGMLALTKVGTGMLTLSGANNTYSGGTTINAGYLIVNNTSGSGTGTAGVMVNSGGGLGGSGTIAGAVTLNSGGIIAPGIEAVPSTLHAASLTWNGASTLQFSLLATTNDELALTGALTKGTGSGFTVNILNNGIEQPDYTLATFASTNFAVGNFTLVLPTGFTGSLVETATSLSLDLSFATSGSTIQNSAPVGTPTFADFTVIGPVTTGTPTQSNTINSLTFTPGSSLEIFQTLFVTQGPVNLVGGSRLTLDGNLWASQLNVLFGGLLNGTGMIIGNLYNAGTVSPGDAPGQIHVSGNYTQTPTGLLQIKIGGQSLPSHDLLSVGGSATLGGTLQLVQLNGFKLQRDEPITFLTAGAGVIGKFANVIDGFPTDTILDPTVVYGSNSVALEAVQGSFEKFADSAGLTPNEKAVAGGLDKIAFRNNPPKVIQYLDDRPLSKLPGDFDKISPEELTSIYTIGVALSQVQSQNIQRRTDDIRSGSSGFSAAGLAINGDGPSFSGGFDITTGVAGPSGDDGKESKEMKEVAPPENRWGAFLSGTGEWVSVGDTNNARGFQLESGGFTLGVDYKLTPHLAVGLAAGYTGTTSDLNSGGRIFVNGGKIGLYGTTFVGGWYADTAVFGGYNSYDTRRTALEGDARSSTDGGEVDVVFGTGYDFKAGGLTFGPTATFNYTYLGLNGFSENGSLAPLNIHGGDADSLRTAVGFKASYDWKMGGVLLKPELRAAWQHEYGDTAYSLDSSFTNGGDGAFTVDGPKLGRDSALLGAGFALQFNERTSVYFYYDGELGRTNYESNSVTGGVRIAF